MGFGLDLTGWEGSRQDERNERVSCIGRTVGIRSRSRKIHNVNCMYEIHYVNYMVSLCSLYQKKKKISYHRKRKTTRGFSVPVV